MSVADTVARGWNAPLALVLTSALMMLPVSTVVVFGLAAAGVAPALLPTLILPVQLFGNFWLAGRRSRKH